MIRVYFDWNVVSNLKRPEFQELKDFIVEHKQYLQFPYSPAHFNDLMKSYRPDNELFFIDLDTLQFLSEKHLLRWGKDGVEVLFGTPKEYFEGEKNKEDVFALMDMEKVFNELDESLSEFGLGKMGTLMKSLYQLQPSRIDLNSENQEILKKMFPSIKSDSTMWDLMKEFGPFSKKLLQDGQYYKDFRKSIGEQGIKLNPIVAGNWSFDEVIKNIDEFLSELGTGMTYLEYVESSLKHKKEPINQYEFYTTAYLMLDMIGYKTDKLPKPTDNMQNIQTDGEHSFYGAHCDYFVAIDKKLRIKSKVLYNEFNVSTKILEPKEFIEELKKVIYETPKEVSFLQEAFSFCKPENLVEAIPLSEENKVETYAFKLPKFYFNFFNYVVYENYSEEEGIIFTFKKAFKNFASFIYYTEAEGVVESITDFFGYSDKEERDLKKKQFVYDSEEITFEWSFEGGLIRLVKDEETKRPILNYIISTKKNKEKENSD
ncbi:MAG: hypothetical protein ACRBG0_28640 [Lewinella sp.]|uniref:hypothetical protein n=1 Tax=Lewinella sp. TaxID=2004506 RepID=UPI003D6BFFDE